MKTYFIGGPYNRQVKDIPEGRWEVQVYTKPKIKLECSTLSWPDLTPIKTTSYKLHILLHPNGKVWIQIGLWEKLK